MIYTLFGLTTAVWFFSRVVRRRAEYPLAWGIAGFVAPLFCMGLGGLGASSFFMAVGLDPTSSFADSAVVGAAVFGFGAAVYGLEHAVDYLAVPLVHMDVEDETPTMELDLLTDTGSYRW